MKIVVTEIHLELEYANLRGSTELPNVMMVIGRLDLDQAFLK